MSWKKKCLLWTAALVLLVSGQCWAAVKVDRYFVNAENNTGYYVDVNSIEVPSDYEITFDLYMVKSRDGYMYRYQAYFNTDEGSYQYLTAKVYNYKTKKLLSYNEEAQPLLSYRENLMLREVVDFAKEWKRTHINKTEFGETWD